MPNSITLPVEYTNALDLIYKVGSLTSRLDNTESKWVGKEFKIKKISVQGPAALARGGAFVSGDVTAAWETVTPDYDRGRKFSIDALDEQEFGSLYMDVAAEYERAHSVIEIDAYRFSKYASTSNILAATPAALTTGDGLLAALTVAAGEMDTNEVPTEGRILFCEASLLRLVQGLDTSKSREILAQFAEVVPVPQGRFYSKVYLNDGTTTGQTVGGFIRQGSQYSGFEASHAYSLNDMIEADRKIYKVTTAGTSASTAPTWPTSGTVANGAGALVFTFQENSGRAINFMIIHPTAVEQAIRRNVTPVDAPDADYDSWRVSNRKYGYAQVKENKVKGIYAHISTT